MPIWSRPYDSNSLAVPVVCARSARLLPSPLRFFPQPCALSLGACASLRALDAPLVVAASALAVSDLSLFLALFARVLAALLPCSRALGVPASGVWYGRASGVCVGLRRLR